MMYEMYYLDGTKAAVYSYLYLIELKKVSYSEARDLFEKTERYKKYIGHPTFIPYQRVSGSRYLAKTSYSSALVNTSYIANL